MGIEQIYGTTIIVTNLLDEPDITDEILDTTEAYLRGVYAEHFALNPDQQDVENVHNILKRDDVPPEVKHVAHIVETKIELLALANIINHNQIIKPDEMSCELNGSSINYITTGQGMATHTHFSDDAFACVYFQTVEEDEGGELILHDPRWQRSYWFGGDKQTKIIPKRGTLVIAPNFVWHEVSTYRGKDPRMTFVLNGIIKRTNTAGLTKYGDD